MESIQQLCRIYWGPSEDHCRQMLDKSYLQPLGVIEPLIRKHLNQELAELRTLINNFSKPEPLFAYLEEGYVRLFVNARGGISAPLYASCYGNDGNPQLMGGPAVQMHKLVCDMGMALSDEIGEPPDHIAIELEVLFFILNRHQIPYHRKGVAEAARFAAVLMIPWIQIFRSRLDNEVDCRFYPLVTSILLSVLYTIVEFQQGNPRHQLK